MAGCTPEPSANGATERVALSVARALSWCASGGSEAGYTGFTSLATHQRVEGLIKGEIDKVNAELARVEQIKSFRILPKALDPEEEGEPVTPTRKVKRKLMYERFKPLVEGMYDDSEERLIAAGIKGALA